MDSGSSRATDGGGGGPAGDGAEAGRLEWFIAGRWQEFEGEARANLFRVVTVCAFYLVELANYHGLDLGVVQMPKVASVDRPFHTAITALCVAWLAVAWVVSVCLRRQVFPASLKYASTACDAVLLTAMLLVADGPRSPLLIGYFVLVNLAGLRLNLQLIRFTTGVSMAGYLVLLGNARWFHESLRVPRYHQVLFLLSLGLAGLFAAQAARRVKELAEDYAARVAQTERGNA
ncbi:MAG: hypothetical protein HY303_07880 [Candidatus Wallbacteria bacterium]|nr:hypothetical protein [Candidatus Wallbacteria bacterium]